MSIEESADQLKLAYLRKNGSNFIQEADQRGLSPQEVLTEALSREVEHRKEASLIRRIRQAKFQQKKIFS